MCGIAGIWNLRTGKASVEVLNDMLAVQHHRGPEGAAFTKMNNGSVLLAFLKLGFTDNQLGMQPLFNEDGSIAIVYNGEIYDYETIRDKLVKRGHTFVTQSDSEVLIHLYEEYGEDFVHQLNGEFAFVIYDHNKKQMLLGRDPFGINPLAFAFHNGQFYFSSEAKGILVIEGFQRQLNPEYFSSVAIGIPNTSLSLFKNIQNLRPGHCMLVSEADIKTYQYWQPDFKKRSDDFETAKNHTRSLLKEAVARRLKGDVPLALALSSGLDSTIIAGLTKELGYDKPVFSLGFTGRSFDESNVAETTSDYYGLRFNRVNVSNETLANNFKKALWHTENSTNSLGNVGRFIMHGAIQASGLKAVMGGEASDEVFGGYPYFVLERIWRESLSGNPDSSTLFKSFKAAEAKSHRIFWSQPKALTKQTCPYPAPNFVFYRSQKAHMLAKWLWSDEMVAQFGIEPLEYLFDEIPPEACHGLSGFDTTRMVSRSIASTYVFPGIGDRLEMGRSLEGRVPFLDKHVINYAYSLPEHYFIDLNRLKGKHLLKEAFGELIPPDFMAPAKHTFMTPAFSEIFKTPAGRQLRAKYLNSSKVKSTGIINPSTIKTAQLLCRVMPGFVQGYLFLDSLIGLCLSIQILHEIFIECHPLQMINNQKKIEIKEHIFQRQTGAVIR